MGAGCSNGALSKEEFIERADAICRDVDKQSTNLKVPEKASQAPAFADRAHDIVEEAIEKLRNLEPPEEDKKQIERMIDSIEEANDYLPRIAQAAADEDLKRFQELNANLGRAVDEANRIANDYGLEVCGGAAASPAD
jgi:hypothetical protein